MSDVDENTSQMEEEIEEVEEEVIEENSELSSEEVEDVEEVEEVEDDQDMEEDAEPADAEGDDQDDQDDASTMDIESSTPNKSCEATDAAEALLSLNNTPFKSPGGKGRGKKATKQSAAKTKSVTFESQQQSFTCLPAVNTYFQNRLIDVLGSLGVDPDTLRANWVTKCSLKSSGSMIAVLDVSYERVDKEKEKDSDEDNQSKALGSRYEVCVSLGCLPGSKKATDNMRRVISIINATEIRERFLLSQLLAHYNYNCQNIFFDPFDNTVRVEGMDGQSVSTRLSFEDKEEGETATACSSAPFFFSIGNSTVLNWGKFHREGVFSNTTFAYPLGFKVLRQEHDRVLDTVVDCLCEVDAICTLKNHETVLYSSFSHLALNKIQHKVDAKSPENYPMPFDVLMDEVVSISPLYRITVAWKVRNKLSLNSTLENLADPKETGDDLDDAENDKNDDEAEIAKYSKLKYDDPYTVTIKVYEASRPLIAWQAVLLETVGMGLEETDENEDSLANVPDKTHLMNEGIWDSKNEGAFKEMLKDNSLEDLYELSIISPAFEFLIPDADEVEFREEIIERRRKYFRLLRQAQSEGERDLMKPRLILESNDQLVDDILVIMLEGMIPIYDEAGKEVALYSTLSCGTSHAPFQIFKNSNPIIDTIVPYDFNAVYNFEDKLLDYKMLETRTEGQISAQVTVNYNKIIVKEFTRLMNKMKALDSICRRMKKYDQSHRNLQRGLYLFYKRNLLIFHHPNKFKKVKDNIKMRRALEKNLTHSEKEGVLFNFNEITNLSSAMLVKILARKTKLNMTRTDLVRKKCEYRNLMLNKPESHDNANSRSSQFKKLFVAKHNSTLASLVASSAVEPAVTRVPQSSPFKRGPVKGMSAMLKHTESVVDAAIAAATQDEAKSWKVLISQAQRQRVARVKEIEKLVSTMRINSTRNFRRKREEIRGIAENKVMTEFDEDYLTQADQHSDEGLTTVSTENSTHRGSPTPSEDTNYYRNTLPSLESTVIPFDSKQMDEVIEIWDFLNLFKGFFDLPNSSKSSPTQSPTDSMLSTVLSNDSEEKEDFFADNDVEGLRSVPKLEKLMRSFIIHHPMRKDMIELTKDLDSFFSTAQLELDFHDDLVHLLKKNADVDPNSLLHHFLYNIFYRNTNSTLNSFNSPASLMTSWCGDSKLDHKLSNSTILSLLYKFTNKLFLKPFETVMNITANYNFLQGLNFPCNSLTFLEILRIGLLHHICSTELLLPEMEVNILMRGRGFSFVPESAEKKLLKLLKKRFIYLYRSRKRLPEETEESIDTSTFDRYASQQQHGVIARFAMPANPKPMDDKLTENLSSLVSKGKTTPPQVDPSKIKENSEHPLTSFIWLKLLFLLYNDNNLSLFDRIVDASTNVPLKLASTPEDDSNLWLVPLIIMRANVAVAASNIDDVSSNTDSSKSSPLEYLHDISAPISDESLASRLNIKVIQKKLHKTLLTSTQTEEKAFRPTIVSKPQDYQNAKVNALNIAFEYASLVLILADLIQGSTEGQFIIHKIPVDSLAPYKALLPTLSPHIKSSILILAKHISVFIEDAGVKADAEQKELEVPRSITEWTNTQEEFYLKSFPTQFEYDSDEVDEIKTRAQALGDDYISSTSSILFRCRAVIQALINHPQGLPFVLPVDNEVTPTYPALISHPLSLIEIKDRVDKSILQLFNKQNMHLGFDELPVFDEECYYDNDIFKFYKDIIIIFENAVYFNAEGSPLKISALKLISIFERLFYEMVLNVENPLPHHLICHTCREIAEEGSEFTPEDLLKDTDKYAKYTELCAANNKIVNCERCDSVHHMKCVAPHLLLNANAKKIEKPKDWYCTMCEQESQVAHIHPMRNANVVHPASKLSTDESSPKIIGEVVAIEQIRGKLIFTIDFPNSREQWSINKVVRNIHILDSDGNALNLKKADVYKHFFPANIDLNYKAYNKVSGYARGYSGWGNSHSVIPISLQMHISIPASNKLLPSENHFYHSSLLKNVKNSTSITDSEQDKLHKLAFKEKSESFADLKFPKSHPNFNHQFSLYHKAFALLSGISKGEGISKTHFSEWEGLSHVEYLTIFKAIISISLSQQPAGITLLPLVDEQDQVSAKWTLKVKDEGLTAQADESNMDVVVESKEPTPNAFTEDEWAHLYLSRLRGKDDALSSFAFTNDLLKNIDFSNGFVNTTIEGANTMLLNEGDVIREELGDFFITCVTNIVKSSLAPPKVSTTGLFSDGYNMDEWIASWDKMNAKITKQMTSKEPQILCSLCGTEEGFLGSAFVYGQTIAEWKNEFSDYLSKTGMYTTKPEDPVLCSSNPLSSITFTSTLLDASIDNRTGRGSSRGGKQFFTGILFCPIDDDEKEYNKTLFETYKKRYVNGSLVMHECCAQHLHSQRLSWYQQNAIQEDIHISETLCGIGYPTRTPLGTDRCGNYYWMFAGSKSIFVGRPHSINDNLDDNLTETSLESHTSHKSFWCSFKDANSILKLWKWLDSSIASEAVLKRIIKIIRPDCFQTSAIKEKEPSATNDVNSSAESSQNNGPLSIAPIKRKFEEFDYPNNISDGASHLTPDEWSLAPGPASYDPLEVQGKRLFGIKKQLLKSAREMSINAQKSRFSVGDNVVVLAQDSILAWNAKIIGCKASHSTNKIESIFTDSESSSTDPLFAVKSMLANTSSPYNRFIYKVKYEFLGSAYEGWYPDTVILPSSHQVYITNLVNPVSVANFVKDSREYHLQVQVFAVPSVLRSLIAYRYQGTANQFGSNSTIAQTNSLYISTTRHFHLSSMMQFSDSDSMVNQLKSAMLLILNALPIGAIDDNEEKWAGIPINDDGSYSNSFPNDIDDEEKLFFEESPSNASTTIQFSEIWKENLLASTSATQLMQCIIMLEYAIRTQWISTPGSKLLSCLPSRSHALRHPTLGAVALRVYALDMAIKYDKIGELSAMNSKSMTKSGSTLKKLKKKN